MKNSQSCLVLPADLFPFRLIQTFFRFPQAFTVGSGCETVEDNTGLYDWYRDV